MAGSNRCETCRFWDSSTQAAMAQPDTTGLCRIRPPVADERFGRAIWPFTEDTDWCGNHAPRANIESVPF